MFSARMSQERKAGRLRSGIFAAFGGALIGCLCPAAAFAADNVGTVTLGWLKSTANLIAVEAPKLSSKHGLKIESVNFNNGVDIATALVNGQIDTALLTPLHLIRAIDGRVDFVQISGNARGNTIVVAAKKLGLAENDWNGLKAANKTKKLRVASSRGSVNELLGVAEFAMNGIDVDKDIDLVNVASFAAAPAGPALGRIRYDHHGRAAQYAGDHRRGGNLVQPAVQHEGGRSQYQLSRSGRLAD